MRHQSAKSRPLMCEAEPWPRGRLEGALTVQVLSFHGIWFFSSSKAVFCIINYLLYYKSENGRCLWVQKHFGSNIKASLTLAFTLSPELWSIFTLSGRWFPLFCLVIFSFPIVNSWFRECIAEMVLRMGVPCLSVAEQCMARTDGCIGRERNLSRSRRCDIAT